ncbi:MAG: hypothetical protein U0325_23305 [Polyangiales bacterium]
MRRLAGPLIVLGTTACAQTAVGVAAHNDPDAVDAAVSSAGDAAAAGDAPMAIDAPDAALRTPALTGCGVVLDLNRVGAPVAWGLRAQMDLRHAPVTQVSLNGQTDVDLHYRIVSFTAPEAGTWAFFMPGPVTRTPLLLTPIARCDPFTLDPRGPAFSMEPLFHGWGRRLRIAQGETVFLRVGQTAPTRESPEEEWFAGLFVRRVAAPPQGDACDAHTPCAPTAACVDGVCVPRGGRGAACDVADPPCAEGLRCERSRIDPRSYRCVSLVEPGASCDDGNSCGAEASCGAVSWQCVRDGALEGRCRASSTPCDAGLTCSLGTCLRVVSRGEACHARAVCPEGTSCIAVGNDARCVAPGDLLGPCREGETPCAEGLLCHPVRRVCALAVDLDAPCAETYLTACRQGTCLAGRCAITGARDTPCRDDRRDACDPDLTCSEHLCLLPLAAGEACDRLDTRRACRDGLCVDGRCVPRTGQPGEPCRRDAPRCDEGAGCSPAERCERLGALGDACGAGIVGCLPGLVCSTGRCSVRTAGERACGPQGTCASGRVCLANECIRPGVCDRVATGRETEPVRCDVDAHCVLNEQRQLICARRGARFGRCRADGSPCDAELACVSDRCIFTSAPGSRCEPGPRDTCPSGTTCQDLATLVRMLPEFRCVDDGARDGRCRTPLSRTDVCDPGLACDPATSRCVVATNLGSRCDGRQRCEAGAHCEDASRVCTRDGSLGSQCREEAPRCDDGAVCGSDERCVRLAAEDEPCDRFTLCRSGLRCMRETSGSDRCVRVRAEGEACTADGGITGGCSDGLVCVREGDGARCRVPGREGLPCALSGCDAGLACSIHRRCLAVVDPGAVCDPTDVVGPLCRGGTCIAGRCIAGGTAGGLCRATAPFCDDGLTCVREVTGGARCAPTPPGTRLCALAGPDRCGARERCVDNTRCVDDGAEDGLCRMTALPRCDPGLRCDAETLRCRR